MGWWAGGLVVWWSDGLMGWWAGGLVGWWAGGLVGWTRCRHRAHLCASLAMSNIS
ncbi:hypothetical protein [Klebsiella quasipneumoniae]|uniref:hypothetical protein n=1 Tax=Klebsiella quasipneumoniae TaxID=1463165 RepID=UPI00191EB79E|nr:hypothetical protein [Klebsiella quasipneumoniae]